MRCRSSGHTPPAHAPLRRYVIFLARLLCDRRQRLPTLADACSVSCTALARSPRPVAALRCSTPTRRPEVERSSVSLKPPPAVPLRAGHHAGSSPPTEIAHQQRQPSAVAASQTLAASRGRSDPADLANEQRNLASALREPGAAGRPQKCAGVRTFLECVGRRRRSGSSASRRLSAFRPAHTQEASQASVRATFFSLLQGWPRQRDRGPLRGRSQLMRAKASALKIAAGCVPGETMVFGASTGRCVPGSRSRRTRSTYERESASHNS